jgi:hypothetical protein
MQTIKMSQSRGKITNPWIVNKFEGWICSVMDGDRQTTTTAHCGLVRPSPLNHAFSASIMHFLQT